MGLGAEDVAFAQDLFSGLGALTTRRMFGGVAFYCDGTIFALMRSDGEILIKGAGEFIDRLEAMGAERWTYARAEGRGAAMPYWSLPGAALDDPEEACALAREALRHL